MSHNMVREWREFDHMTEMPLLEDLVFVGNPLEEEMSAAGRYTEEVVRRLLFLRKLDGFPVIRESEEEAAEEQTGILDLEEIERMAADSDQEEEVPAGAAADEDEDTRAPSVTEDEE